MYSIKIIGGILVALLISIFSTLPVAAQHWVRVPSPVPGHFYNISFFTPGGTGYIPGDTILKTNDGGATWTVDTTLAPGGITIVSETRGFYIPRKGQSRWPSKLYRTTDGGRTWLPVPNPAFENSSFGGMIAFRARDQIVAVAENSGSLSWYTRWHRSTDGGSTWDYIPTEVINYGMEIIDANTVYAGGYAANEVDGPLNISSRRPLGPQSVTTDGKTFMSLPVMRYVPATGLLFAEGFQGKNYQLPLSNEGLYVSKDGGYIFSPIYLSTRGINSIDFTPDGRNGAVVFGNADSNRRWLMRTTDGGGTWGLQRIDNADTVINSVHLVDSANIFLVGEGGLILRTTDGGGPIIPIATLGVGGEGSPRGTVPETLLFPNPATARVRVRVRGAVGQAINCTITDMMGRRVKALRFTGEQSVDVSDLAPGSYVVQCRSSGHTQVQQLMVVR